MHLAFNIMHTYQRFLLKAYAYLAVGHYIINNYIINVNNNDDVIVYMGLMA